LRTTVVTELGVAEVQRRGDLRDGGEAVVGRDFVAGDLSLRLEAIEGIVDCKN
jgi:hypothetical protein